MKAEGLQPSGAFKLRGATNAVRALQPTAVVTASSGNHGLALAMAANAAGIKCTVVMPEGSSPLKTQRIEAAGAEVIECEASTPARESAAQRVCAARNVTLIPPYDHPLVMAGQGTCGLEIMQDAPDTAMVVVPVGGGGLLSGILTIIKDRSPAIRVIGVEPEGADDTRRSLDKGERVFIDYSETICDGVRAQTPGALTFPIIQTLVDDIVVVTDNEVRAAMGLIVESGLTPEPSGALSVAGALAVSAPEATVCVVSGSNISVADLHRLL